MKRTLAIILTALLLVSLFAGCGTKDGGDANSGGDAGSGNSSGGGDAGSGNSSEPKGDVTLTIAVNVDVQEAFEALINDFETTHPGIKMDLLMIPPAIADFLQPAIASDTFPDVTSINADAFGRRLADEGWLTDMRGSGAENLVSEVVIPFFTSGTGVFYGLPYGIATTLIYYNADMFEQYGLSVPKDWNEFLDVCEVLKGNGVAPLSVAIADSGGNTIWSSAFNNNIVPGNPDWEEQMLDGSFNFKQPGVVDIFDRLKVLSDKGYMQPGAIGALWQDSIDTFNQGNAAMLFAGVWFAGSVDGVAPFTVKAMAPPFNMPGAPNYVAVAPETGMAGGGRSPHQDEIKAWLLHFVGDGRNILQNARGNVPITRNTQGSILPPVVEDVLSSIMGSPNAGTLYFVYLPAVFVTDLHKVMQDVLTGVLTPEEAATEMQVIYDAAF